MNPMSDSNSIPDDIVEAAEIAAAKEHHEGFRAAQRAVGVDPMPYEALSERTRRIQRNQVRGAVVAALDAVWPMVEAHWRNTIADEIAALPMRRTGGGYLGDLFTGPTMREMAQAVARGKGDQ
jgi:hypothetical protein